MGVADAMVSYVNIRARLSAFSGDHDLSACQLQTLDSVLAVRSTWNNSRAEVVVSTIPSGLIFKGFAIATSVARGGLQITAVQQLTRYWPHEHCTPAGVDTRFCACNPHVRHRLKPEDRFWDQWP